MGNKTRTTTQVATPDSRSSTKKDEKEKLATRSMMTFGWISSGVYVSILALLISSIDISQYGEEGHHLEKLNGYQILASILIIAALAARAKIKKSLSDQAIVVACIVALPIFVLSFSVGIAFGTFFLVSDRATRFGVNRKQNRTETNPHETTRTASQVLANSLAPCQYVILGYLDLKRRHHFYIAALCSVASACADTLASEITPVISDAKPCDILPPWKPLPIGTDGAITLDGTLISFVGGCISVVPLWAFGICENSDLLICGIFGLAGSLIDSILGAAFERSTSQWKLLQNDEVNLLSNIIAGLLAFIYSSWTYVETLQLI